MSRLIVKKPNCVSLTPKKPSTAAGLPWLARVFHTDKNVMLIPYLMLRPSFALDCHYTLHIAIVDSWYLLIGGHRRSERLGPNIGRQGQLLGCLPRGKRDGQERLPGLMSPEHPRGITSYLYGRL